MSRSGIVVRHRLLRRLAAAFSLVLLTPLAMLQPWPLPAMRNAAFDWMEQRMPRAVAELPLVVVDIDDQSLAELGQWPWPRRVLAQMTDQLAAAGARVVVFDILFAETDRADPAGDRAFADSLRRLPTVGGLAFTQLPATVIAPPGPPVAGFASIGPDPLPKLPAFVGAVMPLSIFQAAFAGLGGLNNIPEPDGLTRHLPLLYAAGGRMYPSLVLETIRAFNGESTYFVKTIGGSDEPAMGGGGGIMAVRVGQSAGSLSIPTDTSGALLLHLGRFPADQTISARRVLEGALSSGSLAGRVALVGTSASGLVDLRPSVLGVRPGVELEAQAVAQILAGDFIRRPDWMPGLEAGLAGLLGGALLLILPRLGILAGAAVGAVALAGVMAASWQLYARWQWLLDPVPPALCAAGVYLTATLGAFLAVERERIFIRRAFSRYLAPALVNRLAADPGSLSLGGERRDMSFLFTDVTGFTAMAERFAPEILAPVLNRYFDGASAVIASHGGLVDQFAGDSILAFFNAPLDQPDHAARALACARDLDSFAEAFRGEQMAAGLPFGQTRIGVHSGPAVVGNFGSSNHFQYAAIGDTVNAAARLEELNKDFGTRVCVSAETLLRCDPGSAGAIRPLGLVRVKGKMDPLDVTELLQPDCYPDSFIRIYDQAYKGLQSGQTEQAVGLLRRFAVTFPGDGPVRFYLGRIAQGHRRLREAID
ncbi:MAG TPA: adenylate/guanylate cyclase domain-containing protein [Rhodospirillaceae bacterium]|nr:adenylate/guanylate cyclase domain-containing protein [Rhodospirillaceae bacterium]